MFRYRVYLTDGSELGEASYAMQINEGDTIHIGAARYRVMRLVEYNDVPDSPFVGMLEVEPA